MHNAFSQMARSDDRVLLRRDPCEDVDAEHQVWTVPLHAVSFLTLLCDSGYASMNRRCLRLADVSSRLCYTNDAVYGVRGLDPEPVFTLHRVQLSRDSARLGREGTQ